MHGMIAWADKMTMQMTTATMTTTQFIHYLSKNNVIGIVYTRSAGCKNTLDFQSDARVAKSVLYEANAEARPWIKWFRRAVLCRLHAAIKG